MADESTDYSNVLSRRRFVELTGVTGAAALAGCDGGDGTPEPTDPPEGTDPPESSPEPTEPSETFYEDVEHVGVTTVSNPSNLQFNPFNTENGPEVSDRLLFERWAQYNYAEGGFVPAGLSDWQLNGDTLELSLREGLQWSNGDAVTAEDLRLQVELLLADEDPISNWVGGVEAVDDQTLEITVDGDINPALLEGDLLTGRFIQVDRATYGDYEGGSMEDLRSFEDGDPVTSGPFALGEKNDQALTAVKSSFDEPVHPDSGNINFGNYVFEVGGNNQQRMAALRSLSRDSDFSLAVPARVVAGFPDPIEEVNYPDVWGIGLLPNHDDPVAGDRAVRQAVAHSINRVQCVNNSLPRAKRAPQIVTGISDINGTQATWIGEDNIGNYESYGRDAVNTEQATTVMEDAGYSKVDGTFEDGDGNTVSTPITVPGGWSDWVSVVETAVSNLNSAGFDASVDTTSSYLAGSGPLKSGDFVFIANTWLHGGPLTYPYSSLVHNLTNPQIHTGQGNYPSWTEQFGGSQATITAPDMDGNEVEWDPNARLSTLASTSDEDEAQQIIRDMAWLCNVDLPRISVVDKIFQSWLTYDDWTVPQDVETLPEAQVSFAPTWLPRKGLMNWRGE